MVNARQLRHLENKSLIHNGDYEKAIEEFKKIIDELGSHIGLLCDLAGCYYESGQFQQFQSSVIKIKSELYQNSHLISQLSQYRTHLCLSKYFEELAEPAMALDHLSKAIELTEDDEQKKKLQINELRILSFFGYKKDLQKKYLHVLEMYNSNQNMRIEILHGLMWTEWSLFGIDRAAGRFQDLISLHNSQSLNRTDQRLICRDFLEISAYSQYLESTDAQRARHILEDLDQSEFDKSLLLLTNHSQPYSIYSEKLSEMMRLRLLIISFHLETERSKKLEIKKIYQFLTDHLSKDSKELFKNIEHLLQLREETKIILRTLSREIEFNGKIFGTKLTRLQIQFLLGVKTLPSLGIDKISQHLWQRDGDESTYHRLRMLIYKLNSVLESVVGQKPFEITKEKVSLVIDLKIETID